MNVVRKGPVDVEFNNIYFTIGKKEILHSVSGKFPAGCLIAILGASGAGKTTLLNVLTGQLLSGFSGEVLVNKEPRDMNKFKKISGYIMQQDLLQPFLTVEESMLIAGNLKLGNNYSHQEKITVIHDVVSKMDLDNCLCTMVEKLSGGERKRLILALELINNPSIIFLDEPTSGLDNVSAKNCVDMLKSLTTEGRTIVCTIHQPSDSAFKLFDIVYFLSEGYCIYNGYVDEIVPFLSNSGFNCPLAYSPADYILEIVHLNPTCADVLSKEIQNGRKSLVLNRLQMCQKGTKDDDGIDSSNEFPVNFFDQIRILLYRSFIQQKRNTTAFILPILQQLICGLSLGLLFYDIGNSGTKSYTNVQLHFLTTLYLMLTYLIIPIIRFPEEVKLLHREYCNRWYSLKAYFAALSISVLPIMVLTSFLYVIIVYPLSGQPMELTRFFWFLLINVIMSLTADGLGYVIGSVLNPLHGVVVASWILAPLLTCAVYNVGHADESSNLSRILLSFSFPYDAWVALTTTMLNDRKPFECEETFCYFGDPKFLLKKMGMDGRSQHIPTLILLTYLIVFKLLSYASLKFRLSQQHVLVEMKLKSALKLFSLSK